VGGRRSREGGGLHRKSVQIRTEEGKDEGGWGMEVRGIFRSRLNGEVSFHVGVGPSPVGRGVPHILPKAGRGEGRGKNPLGKTREGKRGLRKGRCENQEILEGNSLKQKRRSKKYRFNQIRGGGLRASQREEG